MPRLNLFLLGPPRVALDERALDIRRRKALALLIYLAVTGQAQPRDTLATLLWPESDQRQARTALRRHLSELYKLLGKEWFESGREQVGLQPEASLWLDTVQFQQRLADCQGHGHPTTEVCPHCRDPLTAAVQLYRDDFLTGFSLPNSPNFDEWHFFQAESLRQELATALERLIQLYSIQQGDPATAIPLARRWLALDPLHELAQRQLMRLYAQTDQPAAALRQYRHCAEILEAELGVSPSAETTELYELIRTGALSRTTTRSKGQTDPPPAPQTDSAGSEADIRIVTVLFAQMRQVADTAWNKDPEEVAAQAAQLLEEISAVLARYERRVDRFLGEGVMAVFGAPQAHEDDPRQAIQAALDIRAAAQALGLEIAAGINTGPVYFGSVEAAAHPAATVLGPVVNLAAQLQEQAGPGDILIAPGTYQYTRQAFRLSPISLKLKDVSQSIVAYRVIRLRRQAEKSRGLEGLQGDLIGRDEELEKLKFALATLHRGQGRLVSLIGEAGVGKSRLVSELKQLARLDFRLESRHLENTRSEIQERKSEIVWLEGRCLEMSQSASYWPFVDIFQAYFAWGPADGEGERARRLISTLQRLVEQGDLAGEQVEEIGPLLGNLLSLRFENDWDERLKHADPEQIRHRTLVACLDFFVALACRQPVALILEDLHWADSLSLDLIALLMERLETTPLLLLCVYRPERDHRCWQLTSLAARKCPARLTEIRLRELTPEQSLQLVDSLLTGEEIPRRVKTEILEKAQGNPFFVEEIIRALIEGEMIYQDGEVWRARAEIETGIVPDSVQSIIQSRVDRLGPDLKQVLQSASVMGRVFRRRMLAQLLPSEIDLEDLLLTLTELAFIYQERVVPEIEYSFKHVLSQETVYGMILKRRRTGLHQQVAEAIEILYEDDLEEYYEQLAYHYERSNSVEPAINYLLKAGEKARRAYLYEEAIAYFQRILDWLDAGKFEIHGQKSVPGTNSGHTLSINKEAVLKWQLKALTGLGQVNLGSAQVSGTEGYFRQAITLGHELALSSREITRLYYGLGEVLIWQGRADEAIQLVGQDGLALLGADSITAETAFMNHLIVIGHSLQGNLDRSWAFAQRTVSFIQRLPYSEKLRSVYYGLATIYLVFDKNSQTALRWAQALEQHARQHHDLRALGEANHVAAFILFHSGDVENGISRDQQALKLFTKIGDSRLASWSLLWLAGAFLALGDLQPAEAYAYQARASAEAVGLKVDIGLAFYHLGTVFLSQKKWPKAVDAFQTACYLWQDVDELHKAEALATLGRVYLAMGQRQEALKQFRETVALVQPKDFAQISERKPPFLSALSGLEALFEDPVEFQAFCHRLKEAQSNRGDSLFVQWFLEPTEPGIYPHHLIHDPFVELLVPAWVRRPEPCPDCSIKTKNGLEVHAPNGRDLWQFNLVTPHILQPAAGDFAAQTVCRPVSIDKPAIGGILLWKDRKNYLRLDRGVLGDREILFSGCLENKYIVIGRGRLPQDHLTDPAFRPRSGKIHLRLERSGHRVKALCSAGGERWFSVGQVEFPVEDPLEVGLHAIGTIDRTIYHGAFPEGTAIRFEIFELWGRALDLQEAAATGVSLQSSGEEAQSSIEDAPLTSHSSNPAITYNSGLSSFRHNLPVQTTPFIGRETEMTELVQLLVRPELRLISLVGPGGMGKTRLALEVAATQLDRFEHGVYWVRLGPLASAKSIVPEIAKALNFSFYTSGSPEEQLRNYLREKQGLLIMDNYEHLLDGVSIVVDLLKAAPGLKILATSRTTLNVLEEQRYLIGGINYPDALLADGIEQFSAVQLFVASARRVRPDFALTAEDLPAVTRICRLAQGMPLALILAATWVAVLTPAEIGKELEHSLDLLAGDARDLPQRQQSMRAVFDHSWRLLEEQERAVFQKLSVFRGGFTREAAETVAEASLRTLLALANKSFLQPTSTRRYEIHELLRQYAAEKLALSPAEPETVHDRHGAYYCAFLQQQEAALKGAGQQTALVEIEAESDNSWAAWNWAVEKMHLKHLEQALASLGHFYDWQGRYAEGYLACQQATQKLQTAPDGASSGDRKRLLARILTWQGLFSKKRGHIEEAGQRFQQSLALLDDLALSGHDTRPERAFTLLGMSKKTRDFDLTEACRLAEASLGLYRAAGNQWGTAQALVWLSDSTFCTGAYAEATVLAEESLAIQHALGDRKGAGYSLRQLGVVAKEQWRFEEAVQFHQTSIASLREIGDWSGLALSLCTYSVTLIVLGRMSQAQAQLAEALTMCNELGFRHGLAVTNNVLSWLEQHQGRYDHARLHIQLSLRICQETGERHWENVARTGLGEIALADETFSEAQKLFRKCSTQFRASGPRSMLGYSLALLGYADRGLGDIAQAQQQFCEALQVVVETGDFNSTHMTLPGIALLLADQGEIERAVELYALAMGIPIVTNSRWFEDVVGRHIAAAATTLPPESVAAAEARGRARDLWKTAEELLEEFITHKHE